MDNKNEGREKHRAKVREKFADRNESAQGALSDKTGPAASTQGEPGKKPGTPDLNLK